MSHGQRVECQNTINLTMKYEYRLHVELPNGLTFLATQQTSGEWEEAWDQMNATVSSLSGAGMNVLSVMLYDLIETPLEWIGRTSS